MEIELYNRCSGYYDLNNVSFVTWVKIKEIVYNTKNMSVIINIGM